jgi:hypothetical protein
VLIEFDAPVLLTGDRAVLFLACQYRPTCAPVSFRGVYRSDGGVIHNPGGPAVQSIGYDGTPEQQFIEAIRSLVQ